MIPAELKTWRDYWRHRAGGGLPVEPAQRHESTEGRLAYPVWIGEQRRDWAVRAGYAQPVRSSNPRANQPGANVIGAIGECMVADWGGVPWTPNVGGSDKLTGDVDGWEVRAAQRDDSALFLRERDPIDRWIVLVTGGPPHFVIRGAIPIWVAKVPRYEFHYRNDLQRQWRVPQEDLSMAELYAWKAIKALRRTG